MHRQPPSPAGSVNQNQADFGNPPRFNQTGYSRTLQPTNGCHTASERGRQDAHAPGPPVGSRLIYHLTLMQVVVRPSSYLMPKVARLIVAAAALSPVSTR